MSALGDRTTESRTGVLVYTDVKRCGRAAQTGSGSATPRDMHNYLVTCPTIDGEQSDPICLNSSGFDPSLFHDDDGRRYLVNMLWDFTGAFVGMACQDPAGTARPADFDWFDYRGRESVVDPTVVD